MSFLAICMNTIISLWKKNLSAVIFWSGRVVLLAILLPDMPTRESLIITVNVALSVFTCLLNGVY